MWYLTRLYLKNFGVFEELDYQFQNNKAILIQGQNLDEILESVSNGSGKSFFLEGIALAFTGDTLKKSRPIKLIRRGNPQADIRLEMRNDFLNQEAVIMREVTLKGSSTLKIYINGEEEKFAGVPEGNKRIYELLDISREDLLNYFIISKWRYKSFHRSSDTDKKIIISRFSGADMLNGVTDILDQEIQKEEKAFSDLDLTMSSMKGKIDTYQEEIDNLSDEAFEQAKKKEIEVVEQTIENLKKEISRYSETIQVHKDEIELIKRERELEETVLKGLVLEDYTSQIEAVQIKTDNEEKKRKSLVIQKREEDETLLDLTKLENELKGSLAGTITCPKCSHKFLLGKTDLKIEDLESVLKETQEEIVKTKEKIEEVTTFINDCKSILQTYIIEEDLLLRAEKKEKEKKSIIERKIASFKSDIALKEQSIENYEKLIKSKEGFIKSNEEQILVIEKKTPGDIVKQYEEKIELLKEELKEIEVEKLEIEEELIKLRGWVFNFKKFNNHLSNKAMKSIEGLSNIFLERAKSKYQLRMEGFKELSTGEVKEQISTIVIKDGEEADLIDYSGGEQGKIEIATIIALQSLVNFNSSAGGLNFLGADEILESVDSKGIEVVIKSANMMNHTIMLVTHVNTDTTVYPNVLLVQKQNGLSTLIL